MAITTTQRHVDAQRNFGVDGVTALLRSADGVTAVERLGKKQDDFMEKLLEIEKSVASNSILISDLAARVDVVAKASEDTAAKSDKLDSQMSTLAAENKRL